MIRVPTLMFFALVALLGGLSIACKSDASGATSEPVRAEPIGVAECASCGMVVREQPAPRGQVVHRDGTRHHFCALSDMIHYMKTPSPHGSVTHVFVETLHPDEAPTRIDTEPRPWVPAEEARYILGVDRPGIMGKPVLVYDPSADVGPLAKEHGGKIVSWDELDAHLIAAPDAPPSGDH